MMVSGLNARLVKSGSTRRLSEAALRALQSGDVDALLRSEHAEFGGFSRMEKDDNDDSSDDDGNSGDSGSGDDDNNDDDDDDDGDGTGGDDDDNNDTVSKADFEAALKRMKAADQRASKAEAELKKINDAKKGDLEKAQDEVTELKTENTTLKEQLQSERLNNQFLAYNKVTWHNPNAAMKLAQSEGYLDGVVGEDGTVNGKALGAALKKLASEHSYLVKRDGGGSSGEPGPGRSGNGKDDKAVKEQDRRRAPALARRR